MSKFKLLNQLSETEQDISFLTVKSEELMKLHNNIKKIRKTIYNSGLSQLEIGIQTINRLKSACSSTIDSYSNKLESYFNQYDWQEITYFFDSLSEVDSIMEELSIETFNIINDLKNNKINNPLRDKVISILEENKELDIAIVSNFVDSNFKEEFEQFDYIKPTGLIKSNTLYDIVIFIGTPYLYGKFDTVFLGKEVIYLSYNFYNNSLKKKRYINSNSQKASTIYENIHIKENDSDTADYYEEVTVSEIEKLSMNRWIELNNYKKSNEIEDNEELVSAKIIQLENHKHYIIFPDASLKVIKIQEDKSRTNKIKIKNTKLKDISNNDWIILKQDTEEEYLIRRSKEIYGESFYNSQMDLINGYKRKLKRKKIYFRTYENLLKDLNKNNVRVNSTMVIKNWIKDTIRPRNLEEILNYLGYEDNMSKRIVTAAEFINKSHIKVGREMGKRLTNYLEKVNPLTLEEAMAVNGEYEFNLDGIGTFKVESVKNIIDKEVKVSRYKLYRIINTNEEIYHE